MALLEEAVDVWRPVLAKPVDGEIFLLLGEVPSEETWQFTPGTYVRCEERIFEGGERGLVAVEATNV